ncbi:MAG: flagellar hook capping FlgD N-terminal domain-containing protein [Myxococcota bacterium]
MDPIVPTVDAPSVPGLAPPEPSTDNALGQDAFLKLLTEQLQRQDPLDPMKNEEFVAQLAQFSSLEQLFALQSTMESVYFGVASMNNATMASLLGTDVVASGNGVRLGAEGDATLHFDAANNFSQATVTIADETGRVVQTLDIGARDAGEFTLAWDGTGIDGSRALEGNYTFSISANNVEGESVAVSTLVVGTIDEMDYSTSQPMPSIQGVAVPLENIVRLQDGS